MKRWLCALLLVPLTLVFISCKNDEIVEGKYKDSHLYLTYNSEHTDSNIVINFLVPGHVDDNIYIHLSKIDEESDARTTGKIVPFEGLLKTKYEFVFDGLEANQKYQFYLTDENEDVIVGTHWFKTLPNDQTPVTVMQGGDVKSKDILYDVAEGALKSNPDVILIGGDIAYANGDTKNLDKWDEWFNSMKPVMISPDKRVLPLIVAIGNHETNLLVPGKLARAPFYFQLFPQRGLKSYFARKLGAHSVLLVLDTGHIYPHIWQVKWMNKQFEKFKNVPNKLAMYHIPLYPGHRAFADPLSLAGRITWQNIFDKNNLTASFENHDHLAKRTHPLKNGEIDPDGTVYFGDGCWGARPRDSHEDRWYLDFTAEKRHVWLASFDPTGGQFQAFSYNDIIDEAKIVH